MELVIHIMPTCVGRMVARSPITYGQIRYALASSTVVYSNTINRSSTGPSETNAGVPGKSNK